MKDKIKTNERELSGKVAQWFNEHIQRNIFPFTSASNEAGIQVGSKTYFGDIIIWENREANKAYSYLELKPPFGASENLERFRKKAIELNVKIAYTWDFQTLNAYELEANKLKRLDSESYSILTNLNDWKRGEIQATIKAYIHRICQELLSLNQVGRFRKFKPEKHYFIGFIRRTVNDLIPIFEDFIRKEHRKKPNRDKINKYVIEQGIAFPSDDEFFRLIASQRVYGLITKIIFYLTIKRYFRDLPDLQQEDNEDVNEILNVSFFKASEKDWQAVFLKGPLDELGLPEQSYSILQELFSHLKIYNFGQLPEDVIGELFEEIIDPEQRHNLGQYFTNEDLVDLMIAAIVNNPDRYYADPTCGSGTFLIRLYSRLKHLRPGLEHKEILDNIWGIDIGKFPAELSTINLFRQHPTNFENFPRVINKDVFKIRRGDEFPFPPSQVTGKNYIKIGIPLPEFYGMVGNFPFIRQELIEKKIPGVKKDLVKLLADEYLYVYPDLFEFKKNISYKLEELSKRPKIEQTTIIDNLINKNQLDVKLSGQADIYSYLFLHCNTLLSDDGSFAIITSNSWLDVAYGSVLKKFILDHFNIKMIVASWAELWFEDVAVNTVFTVLERNDDEATRDTNMVHFVKLKKRLSDLIKERDLDLESRKRWQRIDGIINTIESSSYKSKKITNDISSFEDENMRIRLIEQKILSKEVKDKQELSKWGKFLRAPDVYFEILQKCKNKLVPLKSVAKVKFGIKTGINDFFYLQRIKENMSTNVVKCKNKKGWIGEIERDYLKLVIKSPRESEKIEIDPINLKNVIFICSKSKEELKKLGHFGALNYIEWGEKQKSRNNIRWPDVKSVQGRRNWWSVSRIKPPNSIVSCGIRASYKVFDNTKGVLADKRLYEVYSDNEFIISILNSFIFHLFIESDTRQLGDGFIDLTVYEVEEAPIPKSELLNETIIDAYNVIKGRKIKSILEEYKQKDRIELDKAILNVLGLDTEEYLPKIYNGITEM